MIKIAYVVGGLPFGGVENWLFDVVLRLNKFDNYKCRIFNVSGTGVKLSEFREAYLDVNCIGNSNAANSTYRMDTVFRLRQQLKLFSPDIIHTLHFSGDYFGRLAAIGLDIPVVTHIHNIKRERKKSRRFFNKILSFYTDAYISISHAVGEVIETDHNYFKRRKYLLYNGLDTSRLDIKAHDLRALYGLQGHIVVGIGRYVEQKNFESLILAEKLLLDGGWDVSLVLVGEGSRRESYEAMIAELGLKERVVLTGYRQDVAAFLRGSDILAMPSFFEGFPIVHLESMYCGVPGVISHHVPSLEVGSSAAVVSDCSVESIASGIESLIRDPKKYVKLAEEGRRIVNDLTIDRHIDRLLAIYDDVIMRHSKRRATRKHVCKP